MNIIVGKTAGFCYGVQRAVEGSQKLIKENKNSKIYCLGELVHNKQVIDTLKQDGIEFIEKIEDIKERNSKVIIRAHGIEKDIYDKAQKNDIEIIDYTCPNVLRIHRIAEEYEKKGYYIFLTGTEKHPEIIGTISYCGQNFSLITQKEDIEEALEKLKKSNIKKLLVISQTTYSMKKFEEICKTIKEKLPKDIKILIKNKICLAKELRQKETQKIAKKVDKMIIIGGKNSSNTKKLYEIASEYCKDTICIETKNELDKTQFKNIETTGIMAGASTPQKSIDEVLNFLK